MKNSIFGIFGISIPVFALVFLLPATSTAQTCTQFNLSVSSNHYTYQNPAEDIGMPFNRSWRIIVENQRAVMVALAENSGNASAGIVKNRNGYNVRNAHQITEQMVRDLVSKAGVQMGSSTMSNQRIKNIPVKEIEFTHTVQNLNERHRMSGLLYIIVKGDHSYLFMFNCAERDKNCLFPFFRRVMKETYFGPDWYRN